MLSRTNLTLIALVTVIATPSLAVAQQRGPEVADFTLANGLELVVIPDHRAPVVTHMIWYKVGAADETPGKSGLAHFLEHLMFKGTAKNPTGKFSQVVARIGGQENAFTSQDYTGYYQRVPSDQLKTVMEFEADRMTGLQLTDDVVLPERNVILEEQNQRIGNNPRVRGLRTGHPSRYSQRLAIGTPQDIVDLFVGVVHPHYWQTVCAQGMESVIDRDFSWALLMGSMSFSCSRP